MSTRPLLRLRLLGGRRLVFGYHGHALRGERDHGRVFTHLSRGSRAGLFPAGLLWFGSNRGLRRRGTARAARANLRAAAGRRAAACAFRRARPSPGSAPARGRSIFRRARRLGEGPPKLLHSASSFHKGRVPGCCKSALPLRVRDLFLVFKRMSGGVFAIAKKANSLIFRYHKPFPSSSRHRCQNRLRCA